MTRTKQAWGRSLAAILACSPLLVQAQQKPAGNYPVKPVRIIVGQSPGGGGDLMVRQVAARLGERLGQSVVVENIPGANGLLGLNTVSKAAADGYTLSSASSATYNATVAGNLASFDVAKAFTPVAQYASIPNVLSVATSLPANNLKEFLAYAKANPGKLNYASGGIGSSSHLNGEYLKARGGFDAAHIPHKGVSPGLVDLAAGRVHFMFASATATAPHVQAGRIRSIAVSSIKRSPNLPDLPTIAEQGLAGYDWSGWTGLLAPSATPRAIIVTLNTPIAEILRSAEIQKLAAADGTDVAPGTPEDLRAFMDNSLAVFTKIVKDLGIKLE